MEIPPRRLRCVIAFESEPHFVFSLAIQMKLNADMDFIQFQTVYCIIPELRICMYRLKKKKRKKEEILDIHYFDP